MEIRVQHLEGVQFDVSARDHRARCDQPAEFGGSDSGMTPPEFLLAALGTCAGYYALQYLKLHSLSSQGLEVAVSADKVKAPARMDHFRIEVTAPSIEERHEAGLLRAVDQCLIRNTLLNAPSVETVVRTCAAV